MDLAKTPSTKIQRNPKSQIPNSKQIPKPKPKTQNPNPNKIPILKSQTEVTWLALKIGAWDLFGFWVLGFGICLGFGIWNLGFVWSLGFGIWDFSIRPHPIRLVRRA